MANGHRAHETSHEIFLRDPRQQDADVPDRVGSDDAEAHQIWQIAGLVKRVVGQRVAFGLAQNVEEGVSQVGLSLDRFDVGGRKPNAQLEPPL